MGVHVAIVLSLEFTYNGPAGIYDIDLTLVNERSFEFKWSIISGCGMSNHQLIKILVSLVEINCCPN